MNECLEDDNENFVDSADIVFSAPDLVVDEVTLDVTSCPASQEVTIDVRVRNDGTQPVPANVPVVLDAAFGAGGINNIATLRTSAVLQPGEDETLSTVWLAADAAVNVPLTITATVDPEQEVYQCDDQNTGTGVGECRVVQ